MVFGKNILLSSGEKFLYTPLKKEIHIPVFNGSNYKNKENMYIFWFQDDSILNNTSLSGNTLYMTAKFFNAKDGNVIDFVNDDLSGEINENNDLYYRIELNKTNYSYEVSQFSGNNSLRVGKSHQNPIKFYQKR